MKRLAVSMTAVAMSVSAANTMAATYRSETYTLVSDLLNTMVAVRSPSSVSSAVAKSSKEGAPHSTVVSALPSSVMTGTSLDKIVTLRVMEAVLPASSATV